MTKAKIEHVKTEALIPYARNSRTHSEQQVAQIAASIREFGFTNPVLIDAENGIIAGHGRVLAAQKIGRKDVPCLRLDHLTEAQKRAYVIADNKLALNAGWDDEMLRIELDELKAVDFDLSLIGFDDDELGALLADKGTDGLTDEDDVPNVSDGEPTTRLGDVWLLGNHRLMCGDSTDAAAVETLLNGVKPHLMVTDPPYGVEYNADWRNKALRKDGSSIGDRATGVVLNDDKADWSEAYALFPGDVAYVWCAPGPLQIETFKSLSESAFDIRVQIVWAKNQFAIGRGHYHGQHETCWYAVKNRSGATAHWVGDRKQSTLWKIDKPTKSETGHSTQKPVECMRRPILNNSSPGQAVYEPFNGSGTTIIACEGEGRHCYAMELNPPYVDVAIKRWQDFTGKQATLEATGQTFADVTGERDNGAQT